MIRKALTGLLEIFSYHLLTAAVTATATDAHK